MKYIFIAAYLLISMYSKAQNSIIGKWGIQSVDNGEIYYNFVNDSIVVYPEFGEVELNDEKLSQIKLMVKMAYGYTEFYFDTLGNYKWTYLPSEVFAGKYMVDEENRLIILESENTLGEIVLEKFPYTIKEGKLEVTVDFQESSGKYILEKI